tara:strand:+ start:13512 stop:13790 length:279 start_codon:yes stop_codon:yes gene_type:complete
MEFKSIIMIYTLEVHQLLNKNNDIIGAEAMVFKRTDDGDLKDCMSEEDIFVNGYDFEDIEDRNFLIENEFEYLSQAEDSFKRERKNLKDYII